MLGKAVAKAAERMIIFGAMDVAMGVWHKTAGCCSCSKACLAVFDKWWLRTPMVLLSLVGWWVAGVYFGHKLMYSALQKVLCCRRDEYRRQLQVWGSHCRLGLYPPFVGAVNISCRIACT